MQRALFVDGCLRAESDVHAIPVPSTIAIVLLVCVAPAFAQSRATGADLTGVVTDSTQGVLPGATVTAIDTETAIARRAETDADGRFVILGLRPGRYQLHTTAPGFRKHIVEDVVLMLGAVVEVRTVLEIAGVEEEVTVAAAAVTVDPQNTAIGRVVTQAEIDALPISRRSFVAFVTLTPGVTTDRIPQPSQGSTPTSGLTFAGQRPRSNNVMVDGLDNNSALVGSIRAAFSQEAVREFQVLTKLVLSGIRQGLRGGDQHHHQERD